MTAWLLILMKVGVLTIISTCPLFTGPCWGKVALKLKCFYAHGLFSCLHAPYFHLNWVKSSFKMHFGMLSQNIATSQLFIKNKYMPIFSFLIVSVQLKRVIVRIWFLENKRPVNERAIIVWRLVSCTAQQRATW